MKTFLATLLFTITTYSVVSADEHVDGYTRKDGTYVAPHESTSPNDTTQDNYSHEGNVNPYTGKVGDRNN